MRFKIIKFVFIFLIFTFSLFALETQKIFPVINCENLSDRPAVLPSLSAGKPAFIIIAFSRPEEGVQESWAKPFYKKYMQGENIKAAYYSVALLEGVPGFVIFFIKNGIKSSTPENQFNNILISYDSRKKLKKTFNVKDESLLYLYLLDKKGSVTWSRTAKKAVVKDIAELFKETDALLKDQE